MKRFNFISSVPTLFLVFLCGCGPVRFFGGSGSGGDNKTTGPEGGGSSQQTTRDVNYSAIVQPPDNKLDIMLVVDNSNSMLADNQKLAQKLSTFVNDLQSSSIDWQMCVTVTNTLQVSSTAVWGASVIWSPSNNNPAWILKNGSNLSTTFTQTITSIGAGWSGTDDERGIKAAWWHLYQGDPNYPAEASGCHRMSAALAVIIISDEDERSVGGNESLQFYSGEYKALETEDLPSSFISQVKSIFGNSKRFTVNSIIVKPGDNDCLSTQDAEGSKSHFGHKYAELSGLTGGGIGSICDSDYTSNLNLFKDVIKNSIASVPLECTPVGNVSVTVTPPVGNLQTTLNGMSLSFNPQIPAGRNLDISYKCAL